MGPFVSTQSHVTSIALGRSRHLTLADVHDVVSGSKEIAIHEEMWERLDETRAFIEYLLQNNKKVYGLTTGFADLRECVVSPEHAAELSVNIIRSHDAGIGRSLPRDVVLGAMLLRANSLSKGNSGFSRAGLATLLGMVNARIIPDIPCTGSLGASGDLAYLARLGRAMMGEEVPVFWRGGHCSAGEALREAGVSPFVPQAKEGLGLTNGTSFMASMLAIAYLREVHEFENILSMQGLFLNAVSAIDAAYYDCMHLARGQWGQQQIARILSLHLAASPFVDRAGVQDDYCIRCVPQIFGPKLEVVVAQHDAVCRELDAITDNPLLFKEEEISQDVHPDRILHFEKSAWVVVSGGNFHGEYLATIADALVAINAKIALTLERQLTYVLNPFRNKQQLPTYLIYNEKKKGLLSGFMITQYAANALAQKICHLAVPTSMYNLTSANESEDVVSYGATAAQRLLEQLDLLHELNTIYLTTMMQAYAIARGRALARGIALSPELPCEQIFHHVQQQLDASYTYPLSHDCAFDGLYPQISRILTSTHLRQAIGYPIAQLLGISPTGKGQL